MRRPFVCANWKLHHLLSQTLAVLQEIKVGAQSLETVDVVVAPVTTVLFAACDQTRRGDVLIAAQNVFFETKGAFTGECSVAHIKELGCSFAIVGHSERRQYFGDTDDSVAKKVKACFDGDLIPIACVGETLEQRKQGDVKAVLGKQVNAVLSNISAAQAQSLVIAYEPVWAIGTGLSATAQAAQEAHQIIRGLVAQRFDVDTAAKVRVIYGGSVKTDNAFELAKEPDIDGALIGGASLEAGSFLGIAREIAKAKA